MNSTLNRPTRQRIWQLERVASGRCKKCGREHFGNYQKCDACRESENNARRLLYHSRIAEGLCPECGRKPKEGKICGKCRKTKTKSNE